MTKDRLVSVLAANCSHTHTHTPPTTDHVFGGHNINNIIPSRVLRPRSRVALPSHRLFPFELMVRKGSGGCLLTLLPPQPPPRDLVARAVPASCGWMGEREGGVPAGTHGAATPPSQPRPGRCACEEGGGGGVRCVKWRYSRCQASCLPVPAHLSGAARAAS